jgi:hypothetical protein
VRVWQRGARKLYLYIGNPIDPPPGAGAGAVVLRLVTQSLIELGSEASGERVESAWRRAVEELQDELGRRLSKALEAEKSPAAGLLLVRQPDPSAAREQIVRLLEQAGSAPGERAALLLLAADWLAAHTWTWFDDRDPTPWNPQIPGLTFEASRDPGSIIYRHDLLGQVWREAPEGEWKEFAFLQLQEHGWDTSGSCEAGSDRFRRVIAEGEAYLAAHPKSSHRAQLLLQVAQAHETAWTVSQAAPDDEYATASSVGPEAGEAARQRAISLYREILRDLPRSEAVVSTARESLPRLELGLTNQQWKYFCFTC